MNGDGGSSGSSGGGGTQNAGYVTFGTAACAFGLYTSITIDGITCNNANATYNWHCDLYVLASLSVTGAPPTENWLVAILTAEDDCTNTGPFNMISTFFDEISTYNATLTFNMMCNEYKNNGTSGDTFVLSVSGVSAASAFCTGAGG